MPLILTLAAYSRADRRSRSIRHAWRVLVAFVSHALRGLVVLAVSVTPGMVSSRSSHTPCVGSLFLRYPSHPAWSCRGPLTRLAWARCSSDICYPQRGLVAVLSHALRGLVVLAVSVTPSVVSSRSSHMPCVGSLFSRYPSRPAWSRRSPLTCLAWARCSSGGWWSQCRFHR